MYIIVQYCATQTHFFVECYKPLLAWPQLGQKFARVFTRHVVEPLSRVNGRSRIKKNVVRSFLSPVLGIPIQRAPSEGRCGRLTCPLFFMSLISTNSNWNFDTALALIRTIASVKKNCPSKPQFGSHLLMMHSRSYFPEGFYHEKNIIIQSDISYITVRF